MGPPRQSGRKADGRLYPPDISRNAARLHEVSVEDLGRDGTVTSSGTYDLAAATGEGHPRRSVPSGRSPLAPRPRTRPRGSARRASGPRRRASDRDSSEGRVVDGAVVRSARERLTAGRFAETSVLNRRMGSGSCDGAGRRPRREIVRHARRPYRGGQGGDGHGRSAPRRSRRSRFRRAVPATSRDGR